MKNKSRDKKELILNILIICSIIYLVFDISFFISKFILILNNNVERLNFKIYGTNFSYLVNYSNAISINSYKCYLIYKYTSCIPFFIFKCYIIYNIFDLINNYKDTLFSNIMCKKITYLYYLLISYFFLRYVNLFIDSILFNKIFVIDDRFSYYFDIREIIALIILILVANFYFLAKKEKIIIIEKKSKKDILSKLLDFIKEKF